MIQKYRLQFEEITIVNITSETKHYLALENGVLVSKKSDWRSYHVTKLDAIRALKAKLEAEMNKNGLKIKSATGRNRQLQEKLDSVIGDLAEEKEK